MRNWNTVIQTREGKIQIKENWFTFERIFNLRNISGKSCSPVSVFHLSFFNTFLLFAWVLLLHTIALFFRGYNITPTPFEVYVCHCFETFTWSKGLPIFTLGPAPQTNHALLHEYMVLVPWFATYFTTIFNGVEIFHRFLSPRSMYKIVRQRQLYNTNNNDRGAATKSSIVKMPSEETGKLTNDKK